MLTGSVQSEIREKLIEKYTIMLRNAGDNMQHRISAIMNDE